jgi:hypothetical protein
MEQKPMTIALFREKLLFDYRTPPEILAHLSPEFAVSPLVVRLAGAKPVTVVVHSIASHVSAVARSP